MMEPTWQASGRRPGYKGPAKAAGEAVRMAAQEQSPGGEGQGGAVLRGGGDGGGEATAAGAGRCLKEWAWA
jgi:hypothetical protein